MVVDCTAADTHPTYLCPLIKPTYVHADDRGLPDHIRSAIPVRRQPQRTQQQAGKTSLNSPRCQHSSHMHPVLRDPAQHTLQSTHSPQFSSRRLVHNCQLDDQTPVALLQAQYHIHTILHRRSWIMNITKTVRVTTGGQH